MDVNNSLSAMNAFEFGLGISAHNIANVNTENFRSASTYYQSGPGDNGVRATLSLPSELPAPDGSFAPQPLPSDTNVAHEMVNLMILENNHAANAQVISTRDDMTGTLLDMKL